MNDKIIIKNQNIIINNQRDLLKRVQRIEAVLNINEEERLGIKIDIESGKKDFLKLHIKKRSC